MKTLEPEFTKKGFRHQQIAREGDVAIYERSKDGASHFEVIRIVRHNGYTIAGAHIPPGEAYPSSETWGARGWTFNDREKAFRKFCSLVEQAALAAYPIADQSDCADVDSQL